MLFFVPQCRYQCHRKNRLHEGVVVLLQLVTESEAARG